MQKTEQLRWQQLEQPPTKAWLLEASALLWEHHDVWKYADPNVLEHSHHVLAWFRAYFAGSHDADNNTDPDVANTTRANPVLDEAVLEAYVRTLITRGRHLLAKQAYAEATVHLEEAMRCLQDAANIVQTNNLPSNNLSNNPSDNPIQSSLVGNTLTDDISIENNPVKNKSVKNDLATSALAYHARMPLCICWYVAGRYREVIALADEALPLVQHYGDSLYEARLLNTRGLAQRVLGDYQQALINLRSSHALYLRLDHPEALRPLANLASLFHFLGQPEQALRHFQEAFVHAEAYGYTQNAALLITQLGDVHLEGGRYDEALEHYQRAIPALERAEHHSVLAVALANAALIYSHKQQFTLAQDHLERAQAIIKQHPHKRYRMVIAYSLGVYQHARGNLVGAQTTLEDALAQAINIEEQRFQVVIHQVLSDVYEAQGNLKDALYQQQQYASKNDALSELKRQRAVTGLLLDIDLERQDLARERAEYALKVQTELLERITDGFLAIDPEGIITYANHVIAMLGSSSQDDLIGQNVADCFPNVPLSVRQHYQVAIKNKQATALEFYFDYHHRWFDLRIYPSDVGSTVYILDITARKQQDAALRSTYVQLERAYAENATKVHELEQLHHELASKNRALERLSQQDGLTKLFNRRTLDTLLSQEFQRAERYHDPLSVMLCDIDNFKHINDRLSHAIGDEVLRQLAALFSHHTRDQDIVARYGGEEFVIAFPETSLEDTAAACEKLRQHIADYPWQAIHPELSITLSMGLTGKHPHFTDYEAMLKAADAQMYRAKTSGKDRLCF